MFIKDVIDPILKSHVDIEEMDGNVKV